MNGARASRLLIALLALTACAAARAATTAFPTTAGHHNLFFETTLDGKPLKLAYALFLPRDYETRTAKRALVVFLVGAGEVGSDHRAIYVHGPAAALQRDKRLGDWAEFIVLSPQCPAGKRWETPGMPKVVVDCIKHVSRGVRVDTDRVYLTGLSMGGTGTWHVALAAENLFAAIAPICAQAVQLERMAGHIGTTTAWIIVGTADGSYTTGSRTMAETLRVAGADVVLTEVPNAGHGVWGPYYANRRFYEFLLLHRRGGPRPKRRPRGEQLVSIAWTPPGSVDARLAEPFRKILPWWTLFNCGGDMDPGLKPELNGRRNVFVTHPLNPQTACRMMTSWPVPKRGRPRLRLVVGHHPEGDWQLIVRADGKEVLKRIVGKATAKDGWLEVVVDLAPWAGKDVFFELLNQPTGWAFEAAYWATVRFETD